MAFKFYTWEIIINNILNYSASVKKKKKFKNVCISIILEVVSSIPKYVLLLIVFLSGFNVNEQAIC